MEWGAQGVLDVGSSIVGARQKIEEYGVTDNDANRNMDCYSRRQGL